MHRRSFFKLFVTLPVMIPALGRAQNEHTTPAELLYPREDCKLTLGKELPVGGFSIYAGDYHWPFLRVGEQLELIRDLDMPQDPNAVAVYIHDSIQIGYVPRPDNEHIARLLEQGIALECRIARKTRAQRYEPGILFTVHLA